MFSGSGMGRRDYSEKLCKAVHSRLKAWGRVKAEEGREFLSADKTVIAVNTAPYKSAQEANDAEMDIDWFAASEASKRRACRVGFAALELQYYLRRICGSERGFDIVNRAPAGKASLVIDLVEDEEAIDGAFEIRKSKSGYLLRGLSIQGALYAVYEYLEQLGCSFLRPGRANEFVPAGISISAPKPTKQKPSFKTRRLHDWRKNRAGADLIDWMGKGRVNVWGSDNIVPGMRKRGILLSSGMHDVLPVVGLDNSFCISKEENRRKLIDGLVEAYSRGSWKDADIADYIGADWGRRCSCRQCKEIGNPADVEVHILGLIRKGLHEAYIDGRLNRDLPVLGYSYFDCEEPPSKATKKDFDSEKVTVEFWSMRCWEHFINEAACNEDFPLISSMLDFLGQRFDTPSNMKIHRRAAGWLKKPRKFKGDFGFGYYFSNAGTYWLPYCQMSVICYELTYLHSLGVSKIAYMHISPSDWGPKAVVNYLYSKVGWDVKADVTALLARYFYDSYGANADAMADVYFAIEKSMANIFNLKRFLAKGLKDFGYENVANHSHIALEGENGKIVTSMRQAADMICGALEQSRALAEKDERGFIAADVPWIEYAADTVRLYSVFMTAVSQRTAGYIKAAKETIAESGKLIERLKGLRLEICLPEKIRMDCAEASGIYDSVLGLAEELRVDLGVDRSGRCVQTSIEPVTAVYSKEGQINPIRWQPDAGWPVTQDGDEVGMELTELVETGVKHMGIVAQRINSRMVIASVGDDMKSSAIPLDLDHGRCEVLAGSSVVCFTGKGRILWRHDFNRAGGRVNTGSWPAFVDMTGKGRWGVTVFVIEDGGKDNRQGDIYMFEALTGKQVWKTKLPEHEYPGGNGSCVADDIDGDGRIEIVYGLCNCVMCVDAQTGKCKWIFDEGIIKICHGRLALCDVNDDGKNEIVVATEYGDDKDNPANDRSSILSLDGRGNLIRRMDNIRGDLGSTQIVVADVDRDGYPEIIHGSENLCFKEPRHMSALMVKERYLINKLDDVEVGGARFAVGDIDGDGYPEAVGITTYRDGGPYVKPEIFCVRVWDGRVKWRRAVSRVWLDGDAIMADVDGDGQLEAIVTTNYPSGYMHVKDTQPWADLYIVKGNNAIIYKKTLPDAAISPIAVDADGDGRVEILIPCYDGRVYSLKTTGAACDAYWPVVCQNAHRTGVYPNNK
ncbi:MAG: hypothetical protein ABIG61_02000 [Planctomycetota bacterium]